MLFLFFTLWAFQTQDPYEKGREILMKEGPTKAIVYFEELLRKNDDPKSLYYVGWSLWRDGNSEEAEAIAEFLIKKAPSERILGHCYYLLGIIETDRLNPEAVNLFDRAIENYSNIGANSSLYGAYCAKAASLIFQEKFLDAHTNLSKGLIYRKKSKNPNDTAYYYELLSRVFFGTMDYNAALDAARESHKGYLENGDPISATHALSSVAFYEILTGQAEAGVLKNKEIDEIIYSDGEEYRKLSFYHAINWILVLRCAEEDYSDYEDEVNRYLNQSMDFFLKRLLNFSLTWNCGQED